MARSQPLRFYAKKLAPNDNSKNQVYLGGGFSALNVIPHGSVVTDGSDLAGSVRERAKAQVGFYWVDEEGRHPAPNAQLILYPKYPEVRMSGFLMRCRNAPADVMRSRDEGRVLFLGVLPDGKVLGYAVFADHPLARELDSLGELAQTGVFVDLSVFTAKQKSSRDDMLDALAAIHAKGWIDSKKLSKDGTQVPYKARNGGGYTLEAELGISPNGYADPDYLGWEVKQFGVNDFTSFRAKSPVTLMTPEPSGGEYRAEGAESFVRRYGYADKSGKPDRINFGGIYSATKGFHKQTGLELRLTGFDPASGKITDMNGGIHLVARDDAVAAAWHFSAIMEHWNRKHAKAVYVPSLTKAPPPYYSYGNVVQLCEETDFLLFLAGVAAGAVYYDPALKIERASTAKPETKWRSQFRVRHSQLGSLYHHQTDYDLRRRL